MCGMLLMEIPDPEDAFFVLMHIVDHLGMHRYYNSSMSGLLEDARVFGMLMETQCPAIADALSSTGVDALLFLTPWLMCLFSSLSYWPAVLR